MAASSTVTYDNGEDRTGLRGGIRKITIDWQSAADGSCTIALEKISGWLIKGVTNPGATAPSANYDIAITDEESFDILTNCVAASTLANRHTANTEEVYFFLKNADGSPLSMAAFPVVDDKLTVAITNAGDSKVGRIILYYRPG